MKYVGNFYEIPYISELYGPFYGFDAEEYIKKYTDTLYHMRITDDLVNEINDTHNSHKEELTGVNNGADELTIYRVLEPRYMHICKLYNETKDDYDFDVNAFCEDTEIEWGELMHVLEIYEKEEPGVSEIVLGDVYPLEARAEIVRKFGKGVDDFEYVDDLMEMDDKEFRNEMKRL